jgi:hypothetical protein
MKASTIFESGTLEYSHAFFAWSTGELGSHNMLYVVEKRLNYKKIHAIIQFYRYGIVIVDFG